MEDGSEWTLKDRKAKTEVERWRTKINAEYRRTEKKEHDQRKWRIKKLVDRPQLGKCQRRSPCAWNQLNRYSVDHRRAKGM